MDEARMEAALEILQLKIVKTIEENERSESLKEKVKELLKEKDKIYEADEATIEKVLTEYSKEIAKKEN